MTKKKANLLLVITILPLYALVCWTVMYVGGAYSPDDAPLWVYLIMIFGSIIMLFGAIGLFFGIIFALERLSTRIRAWYRTLP